MLLGMDTFVDATRQTHIAANILMLLGAAVAVAGARAGVTGDWREGGPVTALAYLVAFRSVAVGLALIGVGLALRAHVTWLLSVSLYIGVGEMLESSYYIVLVRCVQRRRHSMPSGQPARIG
jgi:hypothetical protein